jgi:hypothetical protein
VLICAYIERSPFWTDRAVKIGRHNRNSRTRVDSNTCWLEAKVTASGVNELRIDTYEIVRSESSDAAVPVVSPSVADG